MSQQDDPLGHGAGCTCWECDQEREEAARFAALPWHRRAWERASNWVRWSRPAWLVRRARWAITRWLRKRGVLPAPKPLNLTAFDEALKEHYRAADVASLANRTNPLFAVLKRETAASDEAYAEAVERRQWVAPLILTKPMFQGVADLGPAPSTSSGVGPVVQEEHGGGIPEDGGVNPPGSGVGGPIDDEPEAA